MTDVTLTENSAVQLSARTVWGGVSAICGAILSAIVALWIRADKQDAQGAQVVMALKGMEVQVGRALELIDDRPSRREWDQAMDRIRTLEARAKE